MASSRLGQNALCGIVLLESGNSKDINTNGQSKRRDRIIATRDRILDHDD